MQTCEIIYIQSERGWRWRVLEDSAADSPEADAPALRSAEAYELFYDCVSDARRKGYRLNIRCL